MMAMAMMMMMMIPGQTFDGSVGYERPLHHPLKMAGLVTELKNLSHKIPNRFNQSIWAKIKIECGTFFTTGF